ncbi:hypothetical protein B0H12DRAFT_1238727 [Mycena haematopus]|nr:hypothetical protein B0H12DRAFT_1238727 [Mycena haematopus]
MCLSTARPFLLHFVAYIAILTYARFVGPQVQKSASVLARIPPSCRFVHDAIISFVVQLAAAAESRSPFLFPLSPLFRHPLAHAHVATRCSGFDARSDLHTSKSKGLQDVDVEPGVETETETTEQQIGTRSRVFIERWDSWEGHGEMQVPGVDSEARDLEPGIQLPLDRNKKRDQYRNDGGQSLPPYSPSGSSSASTASTRQCATTLLRWCIFRIAVVASLHLVLLRVYHTAITLAFLLLDSTRPNLLLHACFVHAEFRGSGIYATSRAGTPSIINEPRESALLAGIPLLGVYSESATSAGFKAEITRLAHAPLLIIMSQVCMKWRTIATGMSFL